MQTFIPPHSGQTIFSEAYNLAKLRPIYQYCGVLGNFPVVQTRMVPGFDRRFSRIWHMRNSASSIVLSLETAEPLKNREQTTTPKSGTERPS